MRNIFLKSYAGRDDPHMKVTININNNTVSDALWCFGTVSRSHAFQVISRVLFVLTVLPVRTTAFPHDIRHPSNLTPLLSTYDRSCRIYFRGKNAPVDSPKRVYLQYLQQGVEKPSVTSNLSTVTYDPCLQTRICADLHAPTPRFDATTGYRE